MMPATTTTTMLLTISLLVSLATISQAEGSSALVCVCRCCSPWDCKPMKGTYQISSCAECTTDQWKKSFPDELDQCVVSEGTFLKAECYNRNAFFPKLTCFVLIGLVSGLIVLGIAKTHIPALAAYTAKYFNY
eukprot:TRINITY_DN17307_c0_g1_i1.p1 TRINITY_DN17307_c0_g1~~TRINITY_DN17307_c0_g1_i1.p1  ORF type:complete len:133 (+),score=21.41 TRINITY_DN17307_c0_g1_i1:89-487(+)